MIVKKIAGKVYGAKLTKDEEKAMDIEILKEIAVLNEKNVNEVDAIILWILHEGFNFGPVRLRRFYEAFREEVKALNGRYELGDADMPWLCTMKLLDKGVDIRKWNQESTDEKEVR